VRQITVNIPEGLLEALDRLVKEHYFPHRAEAIRNAIQLLIDEHRNLSISLLRSEGVEVK